MELPQIPTRCLNCPGLTMYLLDSGDISTRREAAIERASESMGIDDQQLEIENKLETFSAMPPEEIDEATASDVSKLGVAKEEHDKSIRERDKATEQTFKSLDEFEEFACSAMRMLIEGCEDGPRQTKRFGIFGRPVIKCGSKNKSFAAGAYTELPDA